MHSLTAIHPVAGLAIYPAIVLDSFRWYCAAAG